MLRRASIPRSGYLDIFSWYNATKMIWYAIKTINLEHFEFLDSIFHPLALVLSRGCRRYFVNIEIYVKIVIIFIYINELAYIYLYVKNKVKIKNKNTNYNVHTNFIISKISLISSPKNKHWWFLIWKVYEVIIMIYYPESSSLLELNVNNILRYI